MSIPPSNRLRSGPHLKLAAWLGLAGMLATAAVLPYLIALMPLRFAALPIPRWVVLSTQVAQAGAACWLLGWLGLFLGARHGLDAPYLRAWVYHQPRDPSVGRHWRLAAALGASAAVLVAALSLLGPQIGAGGQAIHPVGWAWRGALASFYGGIVEEVECRLLLVSLLVWLLAWCNRQHARPWMFIVAITLAALLFGAGHLPAAFAIGMAHTPLLIGKIVLLNALVGLMSGTLFWKYGLEHAMLAHFCADLVLHVGMPLASQL